MSAPAGRRLRYGHVTLIAFLRLAIVGVIVIGVNLRSSAPGAIFNAAALGAALYALAMLAAVLSGRRLRASAIWVSADLLFLLLLAWSTGGALPNLRLAFAAFPFVAAFLAPPRQTLLWAVLATAAYVAVSVAPGPVPIRPDPDSVLTGALGLAWVGALAVALSLVRSRRDEEIMRLAAGRRSLAAQAMDAAAVERRRLARFLHDEAVQTLLAARQDISAAVRGDPRALDRIDFALETTVAQLRDTMFELHPHVLEYGGLARAVQAVAERQAALGGFGVEVTVDQRAEALHDELVFAVTRELLVNAARHSRARQVSVDIACSDSSVEIRVADDGEGFAVGRLASARSEGHIGLASAEERVAAMGGALRVEGRPGLGARVCVTLPLPRPAAPVDGPRQGAGNPSRLAAVPALGGLQASPVRAAAD